MNLVFYLQWNVITGYNDAPLLIQGKNQQGENCWFYISQRELNAREAQIPRILFNDTELYLRKGSYKQISEDLFVERGTSLKQEQIFTYQPGQEISFYELARILEESNINSKISNPLGIFYTINTNLAYDISFGSTTLSPYNILVNNNQITNLGFSSKYSGYNLLLFSDPKIVLPEWTKLLSGPLYEQVFRGLSSSGNWEVLSDSEYGSLFQICSGWGKQTVCVNNDKDFVFGYLDKNTKNGEVIKGETRKNFLNLVNIIAPNLSGQLSSAFRQYIDFKKYNNLLKNAGLQIEDKK